MHEGTPIKSHIADFFSITNNLDKIEVKIEDENQELLLLCSLPSTYKSFKKAIIYGAKSTFMINEIKECLLNKNKIDNQFTVSLIAMILGKLTLQKRSNNKSFTDNSKHKNLV